MSEGILSIFIDFLIQDPICDIKFNSILNNNNEYQLHYYRTGYNS